MERLLRAAARIESAIEEPLTVKTVAEAAGLSVFHFCRYFRAMTGDSVMGYVRARRLSLAVPRLSESDDRLIEIAFDAGFESQEAFTRAFKRRFGVTPGAVRRGRAWIEPARLQPSLSELCLKARQEGMTMEPTFKKLSAMKIAGLRQRVMKAAPSQIPALWETLNDRMADYRDAVQGTAYGVCLHTPEAGPDGFDYLAGLEVGEFVPVGMTAITLPQQEYAVFSFRLASTDLSLEFRKAYGFIFETWLPNSGYRMAQAADFERYQKHRFDAQTLMGEVDIFLPVSRQ